MENKNDMFNKTPKSGKPKMFRFNLYWMYGLIFIMLVALYMTNDSSGTKELGWTEFQKLAQENVFDKMTVYNKKNLVELSLIHISEPTIHKSGSRKAMTLSGISWFHSARLSY